VRDGSGGVAVMAYFEDLGTITLFT